MATLHAPGRLGRLLIGMLLMLTMLAPAGAHGDRITVFAAASLTDALGAVAHAWEQTSGQKVALSFASSSTLARQIVEGAPADIYLSADKKWMDYVAAQDAIRPQTRSNLLANQLALVVPVTSPVDKVVIKPGFRLAKLLHGGRLAIGNPSHVPAGIYAKQALTALGVWSSVRAHVARSANVRAALALVALDEAPLGIVYRTDALASDKVKVVGLFPASSHKPVVYPAAITRHADPDDKAVRGFFRFLHSPQAAKIFQAQGFKVLD